MPDPIQFPSPSPQFSLTQTSETPPETETIPINEPDAPEDTIAISDQASADTTTLLDNLLGGGRITIGTYSDRVEVPRSQHRQRLYQNDRDVVSSHARLLEAKADTAFAIRSIQTTMSDLHGRMEEISAEQTQQVEDANALATDYNDQITVNDQSALNVLNIGTGAFNAGLISRQVYIDQFVEPYNLYVCGDEDGSGTGGRNVEIQEAADAYEEGIETLNGFKEANNTTIGEINDESGQFTIPAIPEQIDAIASPTALLPTVTISTIPSQQTLPNITPPPYAPANPPMNFTVDPRTPLPLQPAPFAPLTYHVFMPTYFQPIYRTITAAADVSDDVRERVIATEDYRRNFNRGNDSRSIINPDTFIDQRPNQSLGGSTFQQGGGGVGRALISNQDSPHLEASLSNSLFASISERFNEETAENLLSSVGDFTLMAMQDFGLLSTQPAAQALNLNELSDEDAIAAFGVTSALSLASQVTEAISNGSIESAVARIVQQQLGATADSDTIQAIIEEVTAAVSLTLLQQAGIAVSTALDAPGLTALLTSLVEGSGNGAVTLTPEEILADEGKRAFLTAALSDGVEEGQQQLIQASIQAVIDGGKTGSVTQFQDALRTELQNQGLDDATANRLADQASTILNQEASGARVFHTDLQDRTSSINLLITQLQEQGLSTEEATSAATAAIDQVALNTHISSDAQFAAALQIQLVNQGISSQTATTASNNLVTAVAATSAASPLEEPESNTPLSRNRLKTALVSHITQLLAPQLGVNEARLHAERAAEILVGSGDGQEPSLLDLLNENTDRLLLLSDGQAGGTLQRSFREFMSPSLDSFVFNNMILDPANTFLISALTSSRILPSVNQPKNYRNFLEFYV